ncbi:MAG TPA: GNAT family N-acetyltransferase [Panacibacter sp.]|nr:GNAT family N-acetyltransferase [Panacibacter sp.]HNP45743.1 GNAT family N-acetyltransferase [Panacibacter sp.]
MEANITIRKLSTNDAALLSRVALKAYCDHYLHLWYDGGDWYKEKSFAPQRLEKELADDNALFFLVRSSEEEAGFLKLNVNAALNDFSTEEALELERIYLNAAAAGRGIGSFLLDYTFQLARSKQKKVVWLKTMDSSKAAISFYKKYGFMICGTHTLEFPEMKEAYRGMYIMRKFL